MVRGIYDERPLYDQAVLRTKTSVTLIQSVNWGNSSHKSIYMPKTTEKKILEIFP